eukprot:844957-Prymnesium_polylepis.1
MAATTWWQSVCWEQLARLTIALSWPMGSGCSGRRRHTQWCMRVDHPERPWRRPGCGKHTQSTRELSVESRTAHLQRVGALVVALVRREVVGDHLRVRDRVRSGKAVRPDYLLPG